MTVRACGSHSAGRRTASVLVTMESIAGCDATTCPEPRQAPARSAAIASAAATRARPASAAPARNRYAGPVSAIAAQVPELREVIDFRNLLSHGYDAVDLRVVWSLARHELPVLLSALRKTVAGMV